MKKINDNNDYVEKNINKNLRDQFGEDDYLDMRKESRYFRALKDDRDFEIGPEDYIFDKG